MTLDEAIEHAKEIANTCDDRQCAADHAQLAEWLQRARDAEQTAKRCAQCSLALKKTIEDLRWKLLVLKAHGVEIVDAAAGGNEIYNEETVRADELQAENENLRQELALRDRCDREKCIEHLRRELADLEEYYHCLLSDNKTLLKSIDELECKHGALICAVTGGRLTSPDTPNETVEHAVQELKLKNAKSRMLLQYVADNHLCGTWLLDEMRELGVEVG